MNHIIEIPEEIIELKSIKKLNLFMNEINVLPQIIKSMSHLNILILCNNQVTDTIPTNVWYEFNGNVTIKIYYRKTGKVIEFLNNENIEITEEVSVDQGINNKKLQKNS